MNKTPLKKSLSIVIPTREGFSAHWLDNLLAIKGDVEFILVHPPTMPHVLIEDNRVKQINAPFRGEIMQRMTGLLNVNSDYTLTINCDEYLTPNIVEIVEQYFAYFPNSWVLRLQRKHYAFGQKELLSQEWQFSPSLINLSYVYGSNSEPEQKQKYHENKDIFLMEIPIAPLQNQLNLTTFWQERKDHHGRHTENFDKKVWLTKLVKPTLEKLSQNMVIWGALKFVPFWCLDRLLGLAIQANFFTKNEEVIGHLLPNPEQIRVEENPPEYRGKARYYVLAEFILLRAFPQYPYIWNLVISNVRRYTFLFIKESFINLSNWVKTLFNQVEVSNN